MSESAYFLSQGSVFWKSSIEKKLQKMLGPILSFAHVCEKEQEGYPDMKV